MVKDFLVSSALDLLLLLFPNTCGPNANLYKGLLKNFRNFSKYKKFIKIFKSTHMIDQKANLQH